MVSLNVPEKFYLIPRDILFKYSVSNQDKVTVSVLFINTGIYVLSLKEERFASVAVLNDVSVTY